MIVALPGLFFYPFRPQTDIHSVFNSFILSSVSFSRNEYKVKNGTQELIQSDPHQAPKHQRERQKIVFIRKL